MDENNSILNSIRQAVGLPSDATDFDTDLLMHINSSIGKLNQNGVGNFIVVEDEVTTWSDLKNDLQVEGNKYFHMIPLFITLNTKLIFDPPPPSTVEYYSKNIDETIWRLKLAYEEVTPTPTDTTSY